MIRLVSILLIAILSLAFAGFPYPADYEKKVDKELKKLFKSKEITKELVPVADSLNFSENNNLFRIKINNKTIAYMIINRVNACRSGGCSLASEEDIKRYDYFYYMSVFDTNLKIQKVKIIDYQSDYGYEICGKTWLKQFVGNTGCDLNYGKEIDAISGATVSGNAIVFDLQMNCAFLKEVLKQQ